MLCIARALDSAGPKIEWEPPLLLVKVLGIYLKKKFGLNSKVVSVSRPEGGVLHRIYSRFVLLERRL